MASRTHHSGVLRVAPPRVTSPWFSLCLQTWAAVATAHFRACCVPKQEVPSGPLPEPPAPGGHQATSCPQELPYSGRFM